MTSDDERNAKHADAQAGWACARLLVEARSVAAAAARIEAPLTAFDAAALHAERGAALGASELARIVDEVFALYDGVDAMRFSAEVLRRRDEALVVSAEEVQDEAARAMAEGSGDPGFMTFAAAMLGDENGFSALAAALTEDPTLAGLWGGLSVLDLLGAFHLADEQLARRVCMAAVVDPDDLWPSLDVASVGRIAEALRGAHRG